MKKIALLAFFILTGVCQAKAFDQKKMADQVMKFWSIDTTYQVSVTTPVPSQYGDLLVATATIRGNPYSMYFTPDEKFFFWGDPVDAVKDPDKVRWANINLQGAMHYRGSKNAPVTIVEFSSFQCPHCKHAHSILENELYKAYSPNQIRWVVKNFPLESNDWAESAAVAAECAGKQSEDAYWKMSELIFSTDTISAENVDQKMTSFARKTKIAMDQFKVCFDKKQTLDKVKADKLEGTKAGVNSTPSFFINGRLKRGFKDFSELQAVIDEKLASPK